MRRFLVIILISALCLALCACGKKQAESEAPAEAAAPMETVRPVSDNRRYRSQEITAENWTQFFELTEIPLYTITSSDVISRVCQNYCVTLREEYQPFVRQDGDFSVRFAFRFDLYVETLEIDTSHFSYRHMNDLLFADTVTKEAVFDRTALSKGAFGTEYISHSGYGNAFFTGWAELQPDTKVWAGFYLDLSQVQLESVEGSIELAA